MSDFLDSLLAQSRATRSRVVAPRLPGRFEGERPEPGGLEEADERTEAPPPAPLTAPRAASPTADRESDRAPPPREDAIAPAPSPRPPPATTIVERERETRIVHLDDVETPSPLAGAPVRPEPIDRPSPAAVQPSPVIVPMDVVRHEHHTERIERIASPPPPPPAAPRLEHDVPIAPAPLAPPSAPLGAPVGDTAPSPLASPAPAPIVHVHIGRIEIEAAPDPFARTRPPERPREAAPSSLDRYLRRG